MFKVLDRSTTLLLQVLDSRRSLQRPTVAAEEMSELVARAHELAQGIVSGTAPVDAAIHGLHAGPVDRLGHPQALQDWCDLDHSRYQDPISLRLIPAQGEARAACARNAASRLLARGQAALHAELQGHLARNARLRPGRLRMLGRVLVALVAVLLPLAVIGFVAISLASGHSVPISGLSIALGLALAVLLQGLAWLFNEGSATLVHGGAGRKVLLLRPFVADQATGETELVTVLASFGEVSAIGQPGQDIPPLGAQRVYLEPEGDGWKAVAARLMQCADLVVLRVGAQVPAGFRWEIERLLAQEHPSRVVLALPQDSSIYESFRCATGDLFPHALPALGAGTMFLAFDAAWRPLQLALPGWRPLGPSRVARIEELLTPHLAQMQAPDVPPLQFLAEVTPGA